MNNMSNTVEGPTLFLTQSSHLPLMFEEVQLGAQVFYHSLAINSGCCQEEPPEKALPPETRLSSKLGPTTSGYMRDE